MMPKPTAKDRLIHQLQDARHDIKQYGVKRLGLFGSYLTDTPRSSSDIDLLVEFSSGKKSYDNFIHLAFFLEELFQKKVDLLTPAGLNPYMRSDVMSEIEYFEIE